MNWLNLVPGAIFVLVAILLGILSVRSRMWTANLDFRDMLEVAAKLHNVRRRSARYRKEIGIH